MLKKSNALKIWMLDWIFMITWNYFQSFDRNSDLMRDWNFPTICKYRQWAEQNKDKLIFSKKVEMKLFSDPHFCSAEETKSPVLYSSSDAFEGPVWHPTGPQIFDKFPRTEEILHLSTIKKESIHCGCWDFRSSPRLILLCSINRGFDKERATVFSAVRRRSRRKNSSCFCRHFSFRQRRRYPAGRSPQESPKTLKNNRGVKIWSQRGGGRTEERPSGVWASGRIPS